MREPLTYEIAHTAAEAAIELGRAQGLHVSVSVVNRSGITKVILSDDGAGPIAVETGRRKAYTSAVTGMPTTVFAAFVSDPRMAAAPPHQLDANLLAAPGGLPITIDGEIIGGIGVGGSDGETDTRLAERALHRIAAMLT